MRSITRDEWERLCVELSGALQGCAATFTTADPDHELTAAGTPFDCLRLEVAGPTFRLLALAGGSAMLAVETPSGYAFSPGGEGSGPSLTIEAAGLPVATIAFAPAAVRRRALRERSVGAG